MGAPLPEDMLYDFEINAHFLDRLQGCESLARMPGLSLAFRLWDFQTLLIPLPTPAWLGHSGEGKWVVERGKACLFKRNPQIVSANLPLSVACLLVHEPAGTDEQLILCKGSFVVTEGSSQKATTLNVLRTREEVVLRHPELSVHGSARSGLPACRLCVTVRLACVGPHCAGDRRALSGVRLIKELREAEGYGAEPRGAGGWTGVGVETGDDVSEYFRQNVSPQIGRVLSEVVRYEEHLRELSGAYGDGGRVTIADCCNGSLPAFASFTHCVSLVQQLQHNAARLLRTVDEECAQRGFPVATPIPKVKRLRRQRKAAPPARGQRGGAPVDRALLDSILALQARADAHALLFVASAAACASVCCGQRLADANSNAFPPPERSTSPDFPRRMQDTSHVPESPSADPDEIDEDVPGIPHHPTSDNDGSIVRHSTEAGEMSDFSEPGRGVDDGSAFAGAPRLMHGRLFENEGELELMDHDHAKASARPDDRIDLQSDGQSSSPTSEDKAPILNSASFASRDEEEDDDDEEEDENEGPPTDPELLCSPDKDLPAPTTPDGPDTLRHAANDENSSSSSASFSPRRIHGSSLETFKYKASGHHLMFRTRDGQIAKESTHREESFYTCPEGTVFAPFIAQYAGSAYISSKDITRLVKEEQGLDQAVPAGLQEPHAEAGPEAKSADAVGIFPHYPPQAVKFLLLRDVISGFSKPCILDIKMGIRGYGLNASPTKRKSKTSKANQTTSSTLGLRMHGMKRWDPVNNKYQHFNKLQGRELRDDTIARWMTQFFVTDTSEKPNKPLVLAVLQRLEQLKEIFETQELFHFYTSSLLVFYDLERPVQTADICMVDFAFTYPVSDVLAIEPMQSKRDEDYLFGLSNLINLHKAILSNGKLKPVPKPKPCLPPSPSASFENRDPS
ncbi:putative inositol polyphosphate kinase [Diplonema papillatum]|nr:putative inositol polyphosphate kinase [Diplonema papillatum]